jgi:peptidyl-prolyl cis-trans isomerase C
MQDGAGNGRGCGRSAHGACFLKGYSMFARAVFARPLLALLLLAALAAPALAQNKPEAKVDIKSAAGADPVVARVNGYEIHSSQVIEQINRLPAQAQRTPPEQLLPMMVEALVNTHLIQEAADTAKLRDDPEVKKRVVAATDDIVRAVFLERLVAGDMDDAKLHERYDQFIKSMPAREEVNARHILVKTEEEAKQIIGQLTKGADFAKLAAEKSIDPAGKDTGGDLGWFTKDQMVAEFANAAFALKKGEITKTPVKTRFGWHVIKLIDRRPAAPPSFEDVRTQIAAQTQNEIIADKVRALRAQAKIEILGPDGKPVPEAGAKQPATMTPMPSDKKP